jgi:hypothetical protein
MLVYLTVSMEQINQIFILKMFETITYEFLVSGFSSRDEGSIDKLQVNLAESSSALKDQVDLLNDKRSIQTTALKSSTRTTTCGTGNW